MVKLYNMTTFSNCEIKQQRVALVLGFVYLYSQNDIDVRYAFKLCCLAHYSTKQNHTPQEISHTALNVATLFPY